jgi:enoyl-CoA hydratase
VVRYERVGSASVLTIDRPERRNAVDGPTATALLEGFEAFVADDDARVLVLTGAGPDAFCAGADLKEIASLNPIAPGGPMGFTRLVSSKPTIAAITGYAVAGGIELACWCDLRVVSPTAKLGCTERRWGVPLIDGGTQRLPRIVGQGRALDLILSGRIVEAPEALAMGLVTEIADDPLARALEMAEGLAAFPQETMLADRAAALGSFGHPLEAGIALEAAVGLPTIGVGAAGASRFAGGEGRGGAGAGV